MTWTVKEAIEKVFSNPECIRVYLKSKKKISDGKAEFYQIGFAETLESALRTFGGFLDLKAELDDEDQRIAHIFVNGDDVIRIKVETDGVESYRFYANPKRIVPETVKELKEIVNMDFQIKPGCVAENAEKINIQELKAFLEKKTDVVDAVHQKILMLKSEIADCIEVLRELDPKQAESSVSCLKMFVMTLEEK